MSAGLMCALCAETLQVRELLFDTPGDFEVDEGAHLTTVDLS